MNCAHNSDDAHKGYNASEDYSVLFATRGEGFRVIFGPQETTATCTATVGSWCYSFLVTSLPTKSHTETRYDRQVWAHGGKDTRLFVL